VVADPAEAARWYRLAADQNYEEAKIWLGRSYAQGRGVEKDLAKAAALYQVRAMTSSKAGDKRFTDKPKKRSAFMSFTRGWPKHVP
jgi:TPR repeat protein